MCFLIQGIRDLKVLRDEFDSVINRSHFQALANNATKLPKLFKAMDHDGRAFPNYFCPVTIKNQNFHELLPMRYRIRPATSSEEVPSKYNMFNARKDALLTRKSWRPLLGRNHGIFTMNHFYEWVERDGKKQLVSFHSSESEKLYIPCLYDFYEDGDKSFYSFAVITDEPAPEVLAAGHDRTPIHLTKDLAYQWLDSEKLNSDDALSLLSHQSKEYFICRDECLPASSR